MVRFNFQTMWIFSTCFLYTTSQWFHLLWLIPYMSWFRNFFKLFNFHVVGVVESQTWCQSTQPVGKWISIYVWLCLGIILLGSRYTHIENFPTWGDVNVHLFVINALLLMFDSVLKLRCSTIVAQLYTQPRGLLGQPGSMGCIPKCCEIATVFHICVKSEGWMLTLRLFDGVIPRFSGQTSDFLDKSIFSRTHPPTFWA